eukprot:TRINITY_DN12711_c0_g1::TRINITY_DN12711_c0_g1_i1::g.13544::m.13544 TRINITY_DN12711_c0_g1::TRINITY_DN12711_c0_g1_i1::g.13544  ORF type:complete len:120 (+),score=-10.86,MR_MLE_C/PF13378.1/0.1 TRINITY_DN12711_c0_g1_i1:51-362(+)
MVRPEKLPNARDHVCNYSLDQCKPDPEVSDFCEDCGWSISVHCPPAAYAAAYQALQAARAKKVQGDIFYEYIIRPWLDSAQEETTAYRARIAQKRADNARKNS